jgi:5-oxopent-3-ene-1,2,5-tricarboxylate decarboxylase/2-hydroxyhepta-2,4-diene-1,7-dioate isomerase
MKIVYVQNGSQPPVWAIAEGDQAYAAQGDVYTEPSKGASLGPISGLKVLSPLLPTNKVVIILDNWRGKAGRDGPTFIIKAPTARINPGETVVYPKIAKDVYFETEVGIVIGKKAKHITVEQAPDYIMGYTIHNDMTAFKVTLNVGEGGYDQVIMGKSFDTFSSTGPCIDTDADPTKLTLRGKIDGEEFYQTSSELMNWNVYELTSWVSQMQTLNPGDVISCGAPPGAMSRETKAGDHITLVIDQVGEMSFDVVAE